MWLYNKKYLKRFVKIKYSYNFRRIHKHPYIQLKNKNFSAIHRYELNRGIDRTQLACEIPIFQKTPEKDVHGSEIRRTWQPVNGSSTSNSPVGKVFVNQLTHSKCEVQCILVKVKVLLLLLFAYVWYMIVSVSMYTYKR